MVFVCRLDFQEADSELVLDILRPFGDCSETAMIAPYLCNHYGYPTGVVVRFVRYGACQAAFKVRRAP